MSHTSDELDDGWLARWPGVLGEEEPPLFIDLGEDEDKWTANEPAEDGREAGPLILCEAGRVAELYEVFDEGNMDGDRPSDGDFGARIDWLDGEDRRIHRKRLSQSLSKPCDTLISCSFRRRKEGRDSGQWDQQCFITYA